MQPSKQNSAASALLAVQINWLESKKRAKAVMQRSTAI